MRVSCGFLVIGLSGKTRTQILPPRLVNRVIATRAASIWRSVSQRRSTCFSPELPNDTSDPLQALPAIRPRCCFRYLTFFGINIGLVPGQFPTSQFPTPKTPNSSLRLVFGSCEVAELSPRPAGGAARRAIVLFAADARRQPLTLVEPHLDADRAVGGERLREAVVDVGAQRLQRQLAVQVPLRARDFRAVQPPRHAHLDAARAEAQRRLDRLAHRAAEGDALLELHRHRLADQLRVELRLLDLLDVDEDLAVGLLLDLLLQLVDFRPLAADDGPRARGVDVDLQLVGGALDLDLRDAGVREARLQRVAQLEILVQQLPGVLVGVPARAPGLVEAEPESVRMDFLTHYAFASFFFAVFLAPALAAPPAFCLAAFADIGFAPARRGRFSFPPSAAGEALIFTAFPATRTVRCAVRLTTRNARPIGAGRIRFCDGPWLAKHVVTQRRSTL